MHNWREAATRAELKAEIQAELSARDKLDKSERDKLATKGDVSDVRLEVEKVRNETERTRTHLLYWMFGLAATGFGCLAGMIAKGFGWISF